MSQHNKDPITRVGLLRVLVYYTCWSITRVGLLHVLVYYKASIIIISWKLPSFRHDYHSCNIAHLTPPKKILSRCWCLATLVKYIQFPICRDGPGVVLLVEAGENPTACR